MGFICFGGGQNHGDSPKSHTEAQYFFAEPSTLRSKPLRILGQKSNEPKSTLAARACRWHLRRHTAASLQRKIVQHSLALVGPVSQRSQIESPAWRDRVEEAVEIKADIP
jgi:hypothetical protein